MIVFVQLFFVLVTSLGTTTYGTAVVGGAALVAVAMYLTEDSATRLVVDDQQVAAQEQRSLNADITSVEVAPYHPDPRGLRFVGLRDEVITEAIKDALAAASQAEDPKGGFSFSPDTIAALTDPGGRPLLPPPLVVQAPLDQGTPTAPGPTATATARPLFPGLPLLPGLPGGTTPANLPEGTRSAPPPVLVAAPPSDSTSPPPAVIAPPPPAVEPPVVVPSPVPTDVVPSPAPTDAVPSPAPTVEVSPSASPPVVSPTAPVPTETTVASPVISPTAPVPTETAVPSPVISPTTPTATTTAVLPTPVPTTPVPPTVSPTQSPTLPPTTPTATQVPTVSPTQSPTSLPTGTPTTEPTPVPTSTAVPTTQPPSLPPPDPGGGGANQTADTFVMTTEGAPAIGFISMVNMTPGRSVSRTVRILNVGTLPFRTYFVGTTAEGPTSDLWTDPVNGLQMEIRRGAAILYDGPIALTDLDMTMSLGPGGVDTLDITVTFPTTAGNAMQALTQTVSFHWTAVSH